MGSIAMLATIVAVMCAVGAAVMLKDWGLRIFALLLILAVAIPTIYILNFYGLHEFLLRYVSQITEAFGVSGKVAYGITALIVVPAAYALSKIASLDSNSRLLARGALGVLVAAYWFALWFGTRDHMIAEDGRSLKCYTISEQGVTYFEKEQLDPRTGERCKWVAASDIAALKKLDARLRSGTPTARIHFKNQEDVRFFAPGTINPIPIVWYYQAESNKIELFDAPGPHPIFGTTLKPITEKIAKLWLTSANFEGDQAKEEAVSGTSNMIDSNSNASATIIISSTTLKLSKRPDGGHETEPFIVAKSATTIPIPNQTCIHIGRNGKAVVNTSNDGPMNDSFSADYASKSGKPVSITVIYYPFSSKYCDHLR